MADTLLNVPDLVFDAFFEVISLFNGSYDAIMWLGCDGVLAYGVHNRIKRIMNNSPWSTMAFLRLIIVHFEAIYLIGADSATVIEAVPQLAPIADDIDLANAFYWTMMTGALIACIFEMILSCIWCCISHKILDAEKPDVEVLVEEQHQSFDKQQPVPAQSQPGEIRI